jgi:hypothetical protein
MERKVIAEHCCKIYIALIQMGIPPTEAPTALRIVARMTERAMSDIAGADAPLAEKMNHFKRLID